MRKVYLVRHANAPAGGDDHGRPLDALGRHAAAALAALLAERGVQISYALCSSARRAQETLETMRTHLELGPASVERSLYLASAAAMRERIAALDDGISSALLVGHNPGIAELVGDLGREGEPEALARMRRGFPPATLAVLELDVDCWADAAARSGRLLEILEPIGIG